MAFPTTRTPGGPDKGRPASPVRTSGSSLSGGRDKGRPASPVRAAPVLVLCAVVTVALVCAAGTRAQLVLSALFCGWALSPFVGLWLCHSGSRSSTRRRVDTATTAIAIVSVAFYVLNALRPLPAPHAFPYLVWPAASWVAVIVIYAASRRPART